MDTNVKGFRYSVLTKILCVVLCFVTFCSAAWLSVFTFYAGATQMYDSTVDEVDANDWTNSTTVYSVLRDSTVPIVVELTAIDDAIEIKNKLLKNRDLYVKEIYKIVLDNIAYENYDEYYEEYHEGTVATTVVESYEDVYFVKVDKKQVGDIALSDLVTKEDVEIAVDDFINNYEENYLYDLTAEYNNGTVNECGYYASYGDRTLTNVDGFDKSKALKSPYYIILSHGKATYSGINSKVARDVIDCIKGSTKRIKDVDFYFYFTPKEIGIFDLVLADLNGSDCRISYIYAMYNYTEPMADNPTKYVALALVLLALSFVFGFGYFFITGKKGDDLPAKPIFYDYIPLELSIAAVGGLGFGAWALVVELVDNFVYDTKTALVPIVVFAAVVASWVLLFFFVSSLSRYIHSDKKFHKHLLTYRIIHYGLIAFKWVLSRVKKLWCKIKASAQRTCRAFFYKPRKFKRNIILIAIGWWAINLGLVGLGVFGIAIDGIAITLFCVPAFILFNFFAIRKVAEYVGNLDKIIEAAAGRQEIIVDMEHLDESLRILVDSMRYTNAELQNAINKAVKDERLRSELITNVSHDLKTPLTSIITYVDLLSKCDIDDPKAREYIAVLDEKGGKLKRLIDDLIEASKVTSGNVTVSLAPMNLSELCLQSTVEAQPDFEKAGLELVVKQGAKPTIVVADGTKVNRVIENLLSNARKYSAVGSRVYVDVYEQGGNGVFEIKNISAQPLDITPQELTERFVRGDKSRNQEGNGLGLSIAKELCSLQQGNLELIIDGDLFKARVKLPLNR
ncbi:MAG: sensor histidine kinase [Eubacterium sp.]